MTANQSRPFTHLVFIGRFQPCHAGHLAIIEQGLAQADRLIILVGSANQARSPKNPFTFEERDDMLYRAVENAWPGAASRLIIRPLRDVPYNDQAWIAETQRIVSDIILDDINPSRGVTLHGLTDTRVGLIGFSKDRTNFYLKLFPDWDSVAVETQYGTISSTHIRADYLRRIPIIPGDHIVPPTTAHWLKHFSLTPEFKWLVDEAEFYEAYSHAWRAAPYPPFIACVDAVMIQSGHILLVTRKEAPGKGLLALPGGHVDPNETFRNAMIRELREETAISDQKGEIPPAMLASFIEDSETRLFDHPDRSLRGRVVTQVYKLTAPARTTLFEVAGRDDAVDARWYELGTLRSRDLFEDHAAIIETMTGTRLS